MGILHLALNVIITLRLIEVETIEQKEFEEILVAHGIAPKRKKDIEHKNFCYYQ